MSHNWSPMRQLTASIRPDEWMLTDGAKKIAVIRKVPIGTKQELMFRAVTYADKSEERRLLGYFPYLRMAVEVIWAEYSAGQPQAGSK